MAHILVVCTANICRSPVGEALLRDCLLQRGLERWEVSSAGTWAQWARGASQFSVDVMAQAGYDISDHRSRMIDEALLAEADLVLCMESGHVEALRTEFPAFADKVYLLSEMADQRYSVHDPYGQPLAMYERMADEVAGLIDAGLDRIIELAG
ncbi:MAG: low molecular weight protein arginine phosphatase [Chloroflexi bacterium]|nr:low molecular weight protein arginine phosphatase [Chloroflexota bacterium]